LGTGFHVPLKILTNQELEDSGIDTTDEWIVKRTGVKERRIAEPDVCSSDLALVASQKALAMAGLAPSDIDLIIMATVTPDTHCPAGANWLQAKLDAKNAVTFDITAACSGFVFALNVAWQYLMAGTVKNVLVVAAEVMTRTVNWKDRTTCILWGDGAGAAVLDKGSGGHRLLSTHIHSDGANGKNLLVPGGGSSVTPITHESVDKGAHYLDLINASATFRVAVRRFIETIVEGTEANGITAKDLDWIIPHQANLRMFTNMSKSLDLPMERFYVTIHKYGNVSSASCAIAFAEAVEEGYIKDGNLVCLPVFGGGLTWGNAMIRW